jgi:hypothetical protein
MKIVQLAPLASCLLSFAAGVAYADGFVRAPAHGPGIAVVTYAGGDAAIDYAADGERFERLAVGRGMGIDDLVVLDDGALLIAHEDPRGRGAAVVVRIVGHAHHEVVLAGLPNASQTHFAVNGPRVAVVNAAGAFLSNDGGRTFAPAARWKTMDGYAFYAASLWLGADGALEALAPGFNTCGSSDLLEDLTRVRMDPDGAVTRAALSFEKLADPSSAWLGPYGYLYTTARGEGTCALRAHAPGMTSVLASVPEDDCWITGGSNGRFAALALGSRIYRVGASAVHLGDGDARISDITPDSHGRALVLYADGRVVRYARRAAPVVVRAAP